MNLNEIYKDFTSDKCTESNLKEKVIEYAYNALSWDKHIEPGDFLIVFIPQVDSIISDYNDNRCKFTHYINKRINWLKLQINREYIIKKEKKRAYQGHSELEHMSKVMVDETLPEYKITDRAKLLLNISNGVITKKTSKKRFLIFVLKCSRLLDDELIHEISKVIDEPVFLLYELKEKLDKLCEDRIKNRDYLVHRNNRLFIEINRDEEKLSLLDDSKEKEIIKNKLVEKKKRKKDIQSTLNRRSYGPKNEEIAQILNIPKGTVDSSLFYMKKELQSLFPQKHID